MKRVPAMVSGTKRLVRSFIQRENTMNDFMIAAAFMVMVLSPCLVALNTRVHAAKLESDDLDSTQAYIPGRV